MELQEYLNVARKRWRTIVLVTLLAVGVAAVFSALATRVYEARIQFFVSTTGSSDSGSLLQGSTFAQQRVKSYAQLLTTPRILDSVVESTGVDPEGLETRVSATTQLDTVLIDVAVQDTDPEMAREIAAVIAEVFPATVADLESPAGLDAGTVKITLVKPAVVPTSPVSPQPVRNIGVALLLGLLAGMAAALVREMLDRTVKSLEDLKEVTGRPVLGVITFDPDSPKRPLIVEVDPRSPRAEAFRALRTNFTFIDATDRPKTILVTSSIAGEGKSTVTMNLALAMAEAGASVCLVEADLRRPKVLEYMGLDGSVGLTDALIGLADIDDLIQQYGDTDLWVVGSGAIPPNPSELLGSASMRTVLDKLSTRFDLVIIDAPPVLPVTDSVILSTVVDGAIVVAGSGLVDRHQLSHTVGAVESVNARILGLVLNRAAGRTGGQYAQYSYHYELPEEEVKRGELRRRAKRIAAS